MCNRYRLSKKEERITSEKFGSVEFDFAPRYNIAPTQAAPIVFVEKGTLVCREMTWGFKPS